MFKSLTELLLKTITNLCKCIVVFSVLVVVCRWLPHQPLMHNISFSTAYYDINHKLLRLTLSADEKYRIYTPLKNIKPKLKNNLQLYEDQWFYYHFGFNPISLVRATFASYFTGKKQGASTITMQLARLKWQLNTKNISGKIMQILRAIELELFYSKNEILEAYFNLAPYGRNIEGIGAASLIYFNKQPAQLNLAEIFTLTVIPQAPANRITKNNDQVINQQLLVARNRLIQKYAKENKLAANMQKLLQVPLQIKQPEQLPFLAPHFVDQIQQHKALYRTKTPTKMSSKIVTTLDLKLQKIIETKIKNFIKRKQKENITNASAILIDSRNMQVKALVGSADYFNQEIFGQVNGTLAKRSPGSTLKPFIYTLGFEQGFINPATILKDVPTNFGSMYIPENYDYKFKGPISVTNALNYSRNIPAIAVASQLKPSSFYNLLEKAEIKKLANEQHYGLSMVIGGAEISAQELATLYATLANQGIWQPLKFIHDDNNLALKKTLFSQEASYMTMDILKQHIRPQDILDYKRQNRIPVYWKTGTSWGFRDTWVAGIFSNYVLIVWVGNFNGKGNNNLISQTTSNPLFFSIIDGIKNSMSNLNEPLRPIPNKLKQVEICTASGKLPTKWCKTKSKTWFIPGVSSIEVDDVFRPVLIADDTGLVACDHKVKSHIEVYEVWSSDILKIFADAGIPKKKIPNQNCANNNDNKNNPIITSPLTNINYIIDNNTSSNNKIPFTATVPADVKKLYWFINEQFLGSVAVNQNIEWQPLQSGTYQVKVIDDQGRYNRQQITVKLINSR